MHMTILLWDLMGYGIEQPILTLSKLFKGLRIKGLKGNSGLLKVVRFCLKMPWKKGPWIISPSLWSGWTILMLIELLRKEINILRSWVLLMEMLWRRNNWKINKTVTLKNWKILIPEFLRSTGMPADWPNLEDELMIN